MTRFVLAAILLATTACSKDTVVPLKEDPKPTPGTLIANLVTPSGVEGAVLLSISGPGLTTVTTVEAEHVVHSRESGGDINVAVFGALQSGPLLRIPVPNVDAAASYTATIREIAAIDGNLRGSLTGYALQFRKE